MSATVKYDGPTGKGQRQPLYRTVYALIPGKVLEVDHPSAECEWSVGRIQCALNHAIWAAQPRWRFECKILHVGESLWILRLPDRKEIV